MPMMVSEMSPTTVSDGPCRFRRSPDAQTVESLTAQIRELASERQRLRESAAPASDLERNRIELARAQWELSHALIERYHSAA